ncbi:protein of unknown function DUF151 [Chloroherpeton thalassium ATCC 35110]|uniref:BFN domain-containing protein n=1 Tax=Chloroherpeton thalassium (strain ATCC 35110 / GB-78) TaxID=517418 RepID=B3QTQ7_CHLT3|nr:bifunctional nuclease family protein [Chloroherpeton thalassium]ACF14255.1 protein of unknown function DUF151 [Chloroherpeton thalassium ATCC 35110]
MKKVQVEILGLSTSPHNNGAYALILFEVGGKRKLPIIIGGFEAQAIALKLENIKAPRPFTHDLIKSLVDTFNIGITEVTIDELRNETFFAKIVCEMNGLTHEIDARPSDAIAVAVRCEAPIFVSEEVMNEAGITDEGKEEPETSTPATRPSSEKKVSSSPAPQAHTNIEGELADLKSKLEEAVQKEDYEKAAKIRDQIQRLSSNS